MRPLGRLSTLCIVRSHALHVLLQALQTHMVCRHTHFLILWRVDFTRLIHCILSNTARELFWSHELGKVVLDFAACMHCGCTSGLWVPARSYTCIHMPCSGMLHPSCLLNRIPTGCIIELAYIERIVPISGSALCASRTNRCTLYGESKHSSLSIWR